MSPKTQIIVHKKTAALECPESHQVKRTYLGAAFFPLPKSHNANLHSAEFSNP